MVVAATATSEVREATVKVEPAATAWPLTVIAESVFTLDSGVT